MKVRRRFSTCITCLGAKPDSWEHIIPSFIGGRIEARLLCRRCNNTFGSSLVAQLKSDPSIRLALEQLRTQIPHIADLALNKATYEATAPSGHNVKAARHGDRFRVLPSRTSDESLIIDTAQAGKLITKVLLKAGATPQAAADAARRFADIPEDVPMSLPAGRAIVKKKMPPLRPALSTVQVDRRLPSLIAFEFLAVIIGDQIYKTGLDPLRSFILDATPSDFVRITDLQSGKGWGPVHAILIMPAQPSLQIQVRLFRWLTFQIEATNIQYNGLDCVYFEDLPTGEAFFAATHQDAHNDEWLRIAAPKASRAA